MIKLNFRKILSRRGDSAITTKRSVLKKVKKIVFAILVCSTLTPSPVFAAADVTGDLTQAQNVTKVLLEFIKSSSKSKTVTFWRLVNVCATCENLQQNPISRCKCAAVVVHFLRLMAKGLESE